jgi:catechol 2,3-dioxygenase-like lactoylglutathione lyase family enzyme
MRLRGIDHIQLAMPRGGEEEARTFYEGILGVPEAEKPPNLAKRGGCWFAKGSLRIHLIEDDFRPARKAHPAFLVEDLSGLRKLLEAASFTAKIGEPLEGYERIYVDDPFGNRIEFLEPFSGQPMGTDAEVLRADAVFFGALVRAQVGELDTLLTDDFSLADLSGGLMSKVSLADSIRSGKLRFEAIEAVETSVRFHGPTAIVTGRTEMRGRFDQTAFVAQSRYTHVYVERDGKFYLAAAQGTSIASDGA